MPRRSLVVIGSLVGLILLAGLPSAHGQELQARTNFGSRNFDDDAWDGKRNKKRALSPQANPARRQTGFGQPYGYAPPPRKPQRFGQGGWFQNQPSWFQNRRRPPPGQPQFFGQGGGTLWGSDPGYEQRRVKPRRRFWWFETPQVREVVEEDISGPDDGEVEAAQVFDYRPDPLVQIADPKVGAAHPPKLDDPEAQSVWQRLSDGTSGARATAAQRKAVLAFYESRGFRPVWVENGNLAPRVAKLQHYLAAAAAEGLDPKDYRTAADVGSLDSLSALDRLRTLARFDIQLTVAALRYAQHASGGRIVPSRLSGYHDLNPPVIDATAALNHLTANPAPDHYLASLHPTHPAYQSFRRALMQTGVVADRAPDEPIAQGPTIREGQRDERVPQIRRRLAHLGFLADTATGSLGPEPVESGPIAEGASSQPVEGEADASIVSSIDAAGTPLITAPQDGAQSPVGTAVNADDTLFSASVAEALRSFQEQAGLRADGILGNATLARLNDTGEEKQVDRILYSMERLRWMPRNFGKRHVLVNQAAFELQVMDNGREVWQTRVIVGKPNTQTSSFSDEMETVEFNPYWGVPQSIIVKEMMPYLKRDPSYLDRKGFEVLDGRGRQISSSDVDWWAYGNKVPLSVRQPPGYDNALGEVKFLFPNSHAIYMHDTPTKSLFQKKVRAFSHGCVRVQNPREFAEVMLGWDAVEVEAAIADGRNQGVKLQQKVPVHLAYFTAWPDASGRIITYPDVYSRDAQLARALGDSAVALR